MYFNYHHSLNINNREYHFEQEKIMYNFNNENKLKNFISNNIISTTETADILGCSGQYVNQLTEENKLIPVKKINYITLFLKSDVETRLK